MNKRSVLFITQYFYPESFRGNDIAFDMARRGWDVTVVTAVPNYPHGHFFPGYGLMRRSRENVNGVHIIRIPVIPRLNNPMTLLLNYLSYAVCASLFIPFHLIRHRYDLCFLQQLSPVTTCLPAVIFKKLTHRPLYTWVLDLWPESLQAAGGITNKWVLAFFRAITRMEYHHSDKILISSKGFVQSIAQVGDYVRKTVYYPNWSDRPSPTPSSASVPVLPPGFRVMFAGNVGEAQDFEHIVEAARLARGTDIRFVIVGDGRKKEWVEQQIREHHLQDNLLTLGHYPASAIPSLVVQADALMATLKDEVAFNLTLPAKISSYMAAGKPIVAMANGAISDAVREAGCGLSVPAQSPRLLLEAIQQLKDMTPEARQELGLNGVRYSLEHFDKEKCLQALYNIIDNHS